MQAGRMGAAKPSAPPTARCCTADLASRLLADCASHPPQGQWRDLCMQAPAGPQPPWAAPQGARRRRGGRRRHSRRRCWNSAESLGGGLISRVRSSRGLVRANAARTINHRHGGTSLPCRAATLRPNRLPPFAPTVGPPNTNKLSLADQWKVESPWRWTALGRSRNEKAVALPTHCVRSGHHSLAASQPSPLAPVPPLHRPA